jgi:hypothetical protein
VLIRAIIVLAVLEAAAGIACAGRFSRSATTVPLLCFGKKCPAAVDVRSPNGKNELRRTFTPFGEDRIEVPKIEIVTPRGYWELAVAESTDPWNDMDVLWSPDSKYVALTGEMDSYIETVRVFAINETGPKQLDVDMQPTQDMAHRLRPICARYVGRLGCDPDQDEDGLNFAAIAWAGKHTLVLMSEVPCDTIWGGIMCQVMGYEVDIPSGRIVRAMTPQEFKSRWQHSMAWNFRIPPKPPD